MTRNRSATTPHDPDQPPEPRRLAEAVRHARIEMAERTGVVIDLRDAELARLEILNDALDGVFADVPSDVELFDRGITPGDPPRLWIDMVAHVVMGRDKRTYRFLLDTRNGRRVLAESGEVPELVAAVTDYVARRLVERERALRSDVAPVRQRRGKPVRPQRNLGRGFALFILGVIVGAAGLFAAAFLAAH